MDNAEKLNFKINLRNVFRPSSPIERYSLFAGRERQVNQVIGAVLQPGQHVILYGERGVGKTSLVKVFAEVLVNAGIQTVNSDTINCDATDDFSSLWHKALKELTYKIQNVVSSDGAHAQVRETNLDALVPPIITPDDVRRALSILQRKCVIVFDEFDRIQNVMARTLMADTIKNLSDHVIDCTLILVGVASSVEDLVAQHSSIDRALEQVPMPRMPRAELRKIINSFEQTGLTISECVVDKIIKLSHGLPHYAHLISLESGLAAIERASTHVDDVDFVVAVHQIVKSKQTVAASYLEAVSSAQKTSTYKESLLACALSATDDHGYFTSPSVVHTLEGLRQQTCKVSDVQRHLNEFISEKRGSILEQTGTIRRYRYRFVNPLLQPYTIIHSLADKLITESQLWIMDQPYYG